MRGGRIVVRHGARATEDAVLGRVAELVDASRRDLSLVRRPVRLTVPSASLRDHLAAALARRCGAIAGCQVSTLFSVALEILRASGRPAGRGTALFGVLVRRFARLEPALRDRLEDLVDGYAVVGATVRDFLDAGFESVHAEALDELLAADAAALATVGEVARAAAVVRVTAAVERALEALGLTHRSLLLRAARDALETAGPDALPTRELLVHGFAEATGVASDLLESLLRVCGGTLYLDRPPDGAGGVESAHSERLLARLSQVAQPSPPGEEGEQDLATPSVSPLPLGEAPSFFAAPDPGAEMREIARRIRRLLDGGAPPEAIGLVARSLDGRGAVIRRRLGELGVPFSAAGAPAPPGRVARDLAVLREVLRRGVSLSLERWLDAARRLPPAAGGEAPLELDTALASRLRLAFFARGASRLEDAARRAPPSAGEALAAAVAAARSLAGELGEWSAATETSFAKHLERLARLLDLHLGWTGDSVARAAVDAVVAGLDVPAALRLSYEEFVLVLLEPLAGAGAEPLGGRGGGVRVLDAMEARGLTFEHLFVFAANRDVLPRPVHEDPLLPDRLRRVLTRLLPDLPVKTSGFDEERHLFAQLLSAAPRVTVSWHERDGAGEALVPSPLVERLLLSARLAVERAPRLLAPAAGDRPVEEELVARAIHAARPAFAELLPLALEEVRGGPDLALARARLAVLEEMDPDRSTREGRIRARRLGPYFGFLGAAGDEADPRRGAVSVTALENLAACPWQTLLRRLLRLAPMPDPLASLPSLRGLLVGDLVHRTLERIAAAGAWPAAREFDALLHREAERTLRDHAVGLAGLARAAAELARPHIESARRLDWTPEAPAVARVEASETLRVGGREGRARRVGFRADRVDREGAGLVYTDYKTGAARRTRRDARDELLARVLAGERLQAAAYVQGPGARAGRYVFLRPDLDDGERVLRIDSGDPEVRGAFEASVGKLLDAWERGVFFPRLVEPDDDVEPRRCASCRVAEACLRRDSGARGRLRRWAQRRREEGTEAGAPETRAFLAVWEMWKRPGS